MLVRVNGFNKELNLTYKLTLEKNKIYDIIILDSLITVNLPTEPSGDRGVRESS